MKIVTLNIWGARVNAEFIDFVKKHSDVDVFCFQEVYKDAIGPLQGTEFAEIAKYESYYLLQKLLPNHEMIFHPHYLGIYGICMCIKKNLKIQESGEIYIYKEAGFIPQDQIGRHARNLQFANIKTESGEEYTIVNVHGLWNGKGKSDTDERLEQSQKIHDFIINLKSNVILCGDFNLRLDTQSLAMIESLGLRNLVREYEIVSTRTSLYGKPEKHADYIFISPGIKEKHFSVMPDEVSDHSPLLLEI